MHLLKKIREKPSLLIAFIFMQMLIGLLADRYRIFSTFVAWSLLLLGILFILLEKNRETNLVVAYIAGSDVLWRMTHAQVFWEYNKYAIILLVGLMMLRERMGFKGNYLLLGYIFLLIPAAVLSLMEMGFSAKNLISFNLSGPFMLFVCGIYFFHRPLLFEDLKSLLLVFVGPAISIAALCLIGLELEQEVAFTTESMKLATGGYGPNQVSMILGMGFSILFFLIISDSSRIFRIIYSILFSWLLIQALLSFSRGGVVMGMLAILSILIINIKPNFSKRIERRKPRWKPMLIWTTAIGALFAAFVLPLLISFTDNQIKKRYKEVSTTGRFDLMKNDIQTALNNPILGVGVGYSKYHRNVQHLRGQPAHTEFTRVLAEHGLLGAIALTCLLIWIIRNVIQAANPMDTSLLVTLVILGIGSMSHAAMRLSAISFCIALCGIRIYHAEAIFPLLFRRYIMKTNTIGRSN